MADAHSIAYIYVIANTVNGKQYVGQTIVPPRKRWGLHCSHARTYAGCRALSTAIRKYGTAAFTLHAMTLHNVTQDQLDDAERIAIAAFGSLRPHGYNLNTGGLSGQRASEETRAKHRANRINETPEARKKRLAYLTGRKADPAHIAKMNAARMKNGKWNPSPEVRFKMGASRRGNGQHLNQAAALRTFHLGRKRSAQACLNIRMGKAAAASRRRGEGGLLPFESDGA